MNILENGELEELYNGTGQSVMDNYIMPRNLKHYKETEYNLSKGILLELNKFVPIEDKIKIITV